MSPGSARTLRNIAVVAALALLAALGFLAVRHDPSRPAATVTSTAGAPPAAIRSLLRATATADLSVFQSFVAEEQAVSYYSKWGAQNPGELERWATYRDAILAGQSPAPPAMTTHYGRALVLAGVMASPPPSPTITTTIVPSTTTTASTSTSTATSTSSTTTPAPAGLPRYGTANGWRLPFRSAADQDFEIGLDVALGAKLVRIGPDDAIIQKLLDKGIIPVILFGGNPTYPWSTTPDQLAVQAAGYAAKWGSRILYECLNEPNIHGWTADAYLPYLRAFHDAVKAQAPTATVLNAGLWTTPSPSDPGSMVNWTARFVAIGGLAYTDLYNVHLYDDPAEHGSWSVWDMTFGSAGLGYYDTKNVRSLIGPTMPIVSTESGGPVPKYTEAKQATIVTDALRAADGIGTGYRKLKFTLIYNVLDDDVAGFGMLRPDRTRRPSFGAFQAVTLQ